MIGVHTNTLVFIAGLFIESFLIVHLYLGHYQAYYPWLWLAGLVCLGYFFWGKRKLKLPNLALVEYFFLLCVVLIFLFVNLHDLTHWYFSAINDEYAFFFFAKSIALGAGVNLFSQDGVYQIVPVLSSYFHALGMRLMGIDNFGWKASIILFVASSLVPLYLLVRVQLGRFYAGTSLVMFSFAHYLWAYLRAGYSNIESVAINIWAMYLFLHADRFRLFLAGVVAGLGFFTFFSARSIIIVMFLFILCTRHRRSRLVWFPLLSGFLATALPIVVVSKEQLILKMLERSSSNPYATNLTGLSLIANNIYRSLLGFFVAGNFGPYTAGPHVYGSLVDVVTATFFGLGLVLCFIKIKRPFYLFLCIWFWISLLVVGGMSQYAWTNVSRLYYLLPMVAILASLGFRSVFRKKSLNWNVEYGVLFIFSVMILGINLYRFYVTTPLHKPMTNQALTVRELTAGRCRDYPLERIAIISSSLGQISTVVAAFESYKKPLPKYFSPETMPQLVRDFKTYSCLIFLDPVKLNSRVLGRYRITLEAFDSFDDYDEAKINYVQVLVRKNY